MDSFQLDTGILLAPFMVTMLGIAGITWLAMLGGSLKFSLGILVKEPPSYLRCLVMAILFMVINIGVFVGFYLTLGPQPWYIITCYQAMLQVILMMVVARVNPFAAILASIAHSFFGGVGTGVIALVLFFTCGSAIKGWKEQTGQSSQQAYQQPAPPPTQVPTQLPAQFPSSSGMPGMSRNPFVQ